MSLPELQKLQRLKFPFPASLPTQSIIELNMNLYAQAVHLKPSPSSAQLSSVLFDALEVNLSLLLVKALS